MKMSSKIMLVISIVVINGCVTSQKQDDEKFREPANTIGISSTPPNRIGKYPDPGSKVRLPQWLGLVPDSSLTPGAIDPCLHAKELCAANSSTKNRRNATQKEKDAATQQYLDKFKPQFEALLTNAKKGEAHFESDHLISLEIGGADDPSNIWPQPFQMASAGAADKDQIEHHSKPELCKIYKLKGEAAADEYLALIQRAIAGGFKSDGNGNITTHPKYSWYDLYYETIFPHTDGHGKLVPNSVISFEAALQKNKQHIKSIPAPKEFPSHSGCSLAQIN